MNKIKINCSKELQHIFKAEKKTLKKDHDQTNYACTSIKLIFSTKDGMKFTKGWYINSSNELIYDIEHSEYINLNMFDFEQNKMTAITEEKKQPAKQTFTQLSLF